MTQFIDKNYKTKEEREAVIGMGGLPGAAMKNRAFTMDRLKGWAPKDGATVDEVLERLHTQNPNVKAAVQQIWGEEGAKDGHLAITPKVMEKIANAQTVARISDAAAKEGSRAQANDKEDPITKSLKELVDQQKPINDKTASFMEAQNKLNKQYNDSMWALNAEINPVSTGVKYIREKLGGQGAKS